MRLDEQNLGVYVKAWIGCDSSEDSMALCEPVLVPRSENSKVSRKSILLHRYMVQGAKTSWPPLCE